MFELAGIYKKHESEDDFFIQENLEFNEGEWREYEEEYKKWIESNTKTYEEFEEDYRQWIERDRKVAEITKDNEILQRFVRRHTGVELDLSEYDEEKDVFNISFVGESFVPNLPQDYVYSGGVARTALERMLKIDLYGHPRDLDVVYAGNNEDKNLSNEVAAKYMPDDYSYGFGVKSCDEEYFETRDFTINEIYFTGTEIHCTKQCLFDTVRGIVRITENEKGESYKGADKYFVQWRLLAKALRFVVLKEDTQHKFSFANEEAIGWEGIGNFQMALNLDRAMGHSAIVAEKFVDELVKRNLLPSFLNTPKMAATYLNERVHTFCFQHIELNDEWINKYNSNLENAREDVGISADDLYDELVQYESMHKLKQKITPMSLMKEKVTINDDDFSKEHDDSSISKNRDKNVRTSKEISETPQFIEWCEVQGITSTKRQVSKRKTEFEHYLWLSREAQLKELERYRLLRNKK